MADHHYLIEKTSTSDNTNTQIKKLTYDETKKEVARILDGMQASETSLLHAEEMISHANSFKSIKE